MQVSLEGDKKINDFIRGKGVYKMVGDAIKSLKKYNVFTSVSFTATKLNYKKFPKVVKYAEKLKVDNVWSDRYIPMGSNEDKDFLMNIDETKEYLNIMKQERCRLKNKKSCTNVSMNRALQFMPINDFPYSCTAGKSLLTVMENADLVPCRRMPIVVGNLLRDNMYTLYKKSDVLNDLRQDDIPEDCRECEHSSLCKGGLKCLTYALTGSYKKKDVGCYE